MKKIFVITIGILVLAGCSYYFLFYVLSGANTPFAKACNAVKFGMPEEQALKIMSEFQNKNDVSFQKEGNVLVYVTPGFSGDFQCYVHLEENKQVRSVTAIFD